MLLKMSEKHQQEDRQHRKEQAENESLEIKSATSEF